jgi:Protein of unknown function (DUF2934)
MVGLEASLVGVDLGEGENGMAESIETGNKAKATAKPRASAGTTKRTTPMRKKTVAERVTATTPTHEEIALLALRYWAERGRQDGQAVQDWLRAERELRQMAS